jgi:allantoin racemase
MDAERISIAILPPIPVPEYERGRRQAAYSKFAGPLTGVDVRLLQGGPELTDSEYELFRATGFMILEAEKAVSEGASGILIDCTVDPGFTQISERVDVPVVGALAASVHLALQLGPRFSVLALDGHWARMIGSKLREYGLERQTVSIEVVGTHVYQPAKDRAMTGVETSAFLELLENAGRKALAAGADTVILGSTTIIEGRDELERALGIPVIAPGIAALKTIETMIELGLRPSRRAYPKHDIAGKDTRSTRHVSAP